MVERAAILAEARTWIGTPWFHQGRRKGVAADCIGFVVETLRAAGFDPPGFEYPNYRRTPHGGEFEAMVGRFLDPIDIADMLPADIVLINWRIAPMHIALVGNYLHQDIAAPLSLIHAMLDVGKVQEHALAGKWPERICSAWRVPGVR